MNDAMYDAMQAMIDLCDDPKQKMAMEAMCDMLCDFVDIKWYRSTPEENTAFLARFMAEWGVEHCANHEV